ncbi:SGNH/GDSL hydrolase family protein [Maribellus sp. YY47]|uniref:SGNH/GDSL hydrolase family protein n=1 Tax=Maribellus sp. YY47 TaxID=2929486 RepID=UPI00200136B1|nr:SGNH/GDSL hydrolase family protein [Maribellus sp. YY47]MCK3682479.1 SGNH/GDSL hydrolase family protein [Maribellus sp. YY47]
MKKIVILVFLIIVASTYELWATNPFLQKKETAPGNKIQSEWSGKKVAFLGDSMTQKRDSSVQVYWEYLADLMGIQPFVYGISGHEWDDVYQQAQKLKLEKGSDIDAIFIFAGTNDYNHNTPLGSFYRETAKETNYNGTTVTRKYRTLVVDDNTFCGRIN